MYEIDADPARVDRDAVWRLISAGAYWNGERTREQFDRQVDSAWRVVGAYETASGRQVGFARAVSDGVAFAYLADVFVDDAHRGYSLGKRIVRLMVDDGPGASFQWMLRTADAHGLYAQFGFLPPTDRLMFRPGVL